MVCQLTSWDIIDDMQNNNNHKAKYLLKTVKKTKNKDTYQEYN